MSTIERLAELAKGATQGEWRVRLSDNATPFIMHQNGEDWTDIDDASSIVCWMPAEISHTYNSFKNAQLMAACNPAAIAQAAAEDAAKTREILALRDALTWYRGIAKEMQKACLHQDSKHMLKLMQELAVDGGSKAKAAITPSPQSDQEEA